MDERWLMVEDICRYLNVSNETVYKWIEQRDMPAHRVGRRWMFTQNEVDDWVRSGGASDKPDGDDSDEKRG
jgi:excisionase family DNA binding protein